MYASAAMNSMGPGTSGGSAPAVPRRSRPTWMAAGPQPEKALPPPVIAQVVREVTRVPIVHRSAPERPSLEVTQKVPLGDDFESRIVATYIQNHLVRLPDIESLSSLVKTISSMAGLSFQLVGPHSAGTASRQDSVYFCTLVATTMVDPSHLVDSLRVSGASKGWTVSRSTSAVHVVIVVLPPNKVVRLILDSTTGLSLVRRTVMQKCFTQIVEPKIAIALCVIRGAVFRKLRNNPLVQYVDDILFQILITALIDHRVVPNILPFAANGNGRLARDKEIWKGTGSIEAIRSRWRETGLNVTAKCTVSGMVRLFLEKCSESVDLDWANQCVLTKMKILDEGTTVPFGATRFLRELRSAVCSCSDTLDFLLP